MRALRPILLAALAVAAGCSDLGPPRGPGTLTGTLRSPHGAEGAAVLLSLGEGVGDVRGVGGTQGYAETVADVTRLVLMHERGGTLSFEVDMRDVARPPSMVLREVAGPDDVLRPELSGYRLELAR